MKVKNASTLPATVAVVGLGLLGRGIATCFLGNGFRVIGCDHAGRAHPVARDYIDRGLREMVEHAGMDAANLHNWQDRYQATQGFDDWTRCDFVVESVDEDLATKRIVFDEVERAVAPDVPIGSNTSAIPITQLQESLRYGERLLGTHWFEPAHVTRFLELIPGVHTSADTMNAASTIARRCGKEPSLLAKDIPGFIVNRLAYALYREALNILELGVADAETIDRSFRNACGVWSTIFGPFRWIDLTGGPELYGKAMHRVLPTLSNAKDLPESIRQLAAQGAQGVKNGHGFYAYTPDEAEQAVELFHAHAWQSRALMDKYFPLQEQ